MSIRIQADASTVGVSHTLHPGAGCPWGTINFGSNGHGNLLYFDNTADIDAVIAELVALRAEMTGDEPHECPPEGWCCGAFRTRAAEPEPPAVVAGEVESAAAPAKRQTWGDHFRDNPAHPASDARLERDRGLSA